MMNAEQYAALTRGAGLVDFSERTQLELTGDDRAAFLHNLSTNEIRKLSPGEGCEAFLLNVQGKIIGHGLVFCGDSLVLETVPGEAEKLLAHLDRYLIRERVTLLNRSADWAELLLAGAEAAALLQALGLTSPPRLLAHVAGELAGQSVSLRAVEMAGAGSFLLSCERQTLSTIREALLAAGFVACEEAAFESARIEAGWPLYGRDITADNLPQEIDRDRQAISFVKGCYLGQETVARIDALGHVNKTLVGLKFSGSEVPAAGLELTAEGKTLGTVKSAAWSPRLSAPLALAYVRRGHNAHGQALQSSLGEAEVVALPLAR